MTDVVSGTGGPRKPDTRLSPADYAVWTLLGGSSAERADNQSGRENLHTGDAQRPSS